MNAEVDALEKFVRQLPVPDVPCCRVGLADFMIASDHYEVVCGMQFDGGTGCEPDRKAIYSAWQTE